MEITAEQYVDLRAQLLDAVYARLSHLVDDPPTAYDARSDQWSVPIGDHGLLFYAVVPDPPGSSSSGW